MQASASPLWCLLRCEHAELSSVLYNTTGFVRLAVDLPAVSRHVEARALTSALLGDVRHLVYHYSWFYKDIVSLRRLLLRGVESATKKSMHVSLCV